MDSDALWRGPACTRCRHMLGALTGMGMGKRLALAFGLLIAFLVGVGALAVERMQTLDESLTHVADVNWAKARLMMSALLAANRRIIDEALERVGELASDEPGRKLLEAARGSWRAYGAAAQTSKELLDQDKLSDAQRKLTDKVVPLLGGLIDAFSAYANHQGDLIELARTQGHERYYAGRALVLALIVIASLVAIAIATLVK